MIDRRVAVVVCLLMLGTLSTVRVLHTAPQVVVLATKPALRGRICLGVRFDYWSEEFRGVGPPLWNRTLARLADLGVKWLLIPVNWRFHLIQEENASSILDFTGTTAPSRDLSMLLRMARQSGFKVILYVGPELFSLIGRESLPTYIVQNVSAAALNSSGSPVGSLEGYLPSIADPWYRKEVLRYLVTLLGFIPQSDDILVEGVVVEAGIPYRGAFDPYNPWKVDYAPTFVSLWRMWLSSVYGSIDRYNLLHNTRVRSFEAITPPRSWDELPDEWSGLLTFMDWVEGVEYLYREWMKELKDVVEERLGAPVYVSVRGLPLPVVPEGAKPFFVFDPSLDVLISKPLVASLEASAVAGGVVANIPLESIESGLEKLLTSVVAGASLLFTTFPETADEWETLSVLCSIACHLSVSEGSRLGVFVPHSYLVAKIFEGIKHLPLELPPSFDAIVELGWRTRWENLHLSISRARWVADWGVPANSSVTTVLVLSHRWMPENVQGWLYDYVRSGRSTIFVGHLPRETFRNKTCRLIYDLYNLTIEEGAFMSSTPVRIEADEQFRFLSSHYVDVISVQEEGYVFAKLLSGEPVGVCFEEDGARLAVLTAFPADAGEPFWRWLASFLNCSISGVQLDDPTHVYGDWSADTVILIAFESTAATARVQEEDVDLSAKVGLLSVREGGAFCTILAGEVRFSSGAVIRGPYVVASLTDFVAWVKGDYQVDRWRFSKVLEYRSVSVYTLPEYPTPPILDPESPMSVLNATPLRNGWRIGLDIRGESTIMLMSRGNLVSAYDFDAGVYDVLFLVV